MAIWVDCELTCDLPIPTLYQLCLTTIVTDLKSISKIDNSSAKNRVLYDGIVLPRVVTEDIFHKYQEIHGDLSNSFVNIFMDKNRCKIRNLNITNSSLTDHSMEKLLGHKVEKLSLHSCVNLTKVTLETINQNSERLVSLKISDNIKIIEINQDYRYEYNSRGYTITAPNLQALTVQRYTKRVNLQRLLYNPMHNLVYLDLSECTIGDMHLAAMPNLEYLILFNINQIPIIDWICSLRKLKHLDISMLPGREATYPNPDENLTKIIKSLPDLVYLDISGTNLAGTGVASVDPSQPKCDIPGLGTRLDNPLEFLGLYGTLNSACERHDIPAIKIAGDANEDQVLTAIETYMDRKELIIPILGDLYHLFRYEDNYQYERGLLAVLCAMETYPSVNNIQICASATLFYIVKAKTKITLGINIKRRIVKILLNSMYRFIREETMLRNGCLTLFQFSIPADIMFEFDRVASLLLRAVIMIFEEDFVQRIAIYLLNSIACQVDGDEKRLLGRKGTVDTMLYLIATRLRSSTCDDVMEVAWSTMWNITDETPFNSRLFVDAQGMEYFLNCLEVFPDKDELIRNMMGLLGNVAEVEPLREELMRPDIIAVLYKLLASERDGIEVSYNATGVLAHIMSDGIDKWTVENPSREMVLERMTTAIKRWPLKSKRNINYRSFDPIFDMLTTHHTPQCQHWAAWALANLSSVYPDKYCPLMESEFGIGILLEMFSDDLDQNIVDLLQVTFKNYCKFYHIKIISPQPAAVVQEPPVA